MKIRPKEEARYRVTTQQMCKMRARPQNYRLSLHTPPDLALSLTHAGKAYCTLRIARPLSYTWICPLSSNIFSFLFSIESQNKPIHSFMHSFIIVWNVFLYKILSLTLRLYQWKSRPHFCVLTAHSPIGKIKIKHKRNHTNRCLLRTNRLFLKKKLDNSHS